MKTKLIIIVSFVVCMSFLMGSTMNVCYRQEPQIVEEGENCGRCAENDKGIPICAEGFYCGLNVECAHNHSEDPGICIPIGKCLVDQKNCCDCEPFGYGGVSENTWVDEELQSTIEEECGVDSYLHYSVEYYCDGANGTSNYGQCTYRCSE